MINRYFAATTIVILGVTAGVWAISDAPPSYVRPRNDTSPATIAAESSGIRAPDPASEPDTAPSEPRAWDPDPRDAFDDESPPLSAQAPASSPGSNTARLAGLVVPVLGVRAADLVDTYTLARGEGRRHDALDIAAARGTPVVAVADGTVLKLFQSERGGITLYELAGDGRTLYYYAHLDRYADGIAERNVLKQGEVIGYVGNSGNAGAGNFHLHFEVTTMVKPGQFWGGTPQNPYPLLYSAEK